MSQKYQKVKDIHDLTLSDFREHPIWGWSDEDSDSPLVVPVPETHLTSEVDEEHNTLFISSMFTLQDGTNLEGNVGIVLSKKWVYLLNFFKGNETFVFSLNPYPKQFRTIEDLAIWLEKSVDQISPIKYTTPYFFNDGSPIAGEIDLETL